jgi:hypothetical protein
MVIHTAAYCTQWHTARSTADYMVIQHQVMNEHVDLLCSGSGLLYVLSVSRQADPPETDLSQINLSNVVFTFPSEQGFPTSSTLRHT